MRHFLGTDLWDDIEILSLLDRASLVKTGNDKEASSLEGKILGMVFFNPSLRTRSSFEAAMLRHGGNSICLEPGKGVWGFEHKRGVVMNGDPAEHIVEAARVLGRYVDCLGVRAFPAGTDLDEAFEDGIVKTFAQESGVPVINFESARRHPCQGLADAMTIREKLGKEVNGKRFVLSWTWHPKALPTAVPVSAAINAARLGMDVTIVHPEGFELYAEDLKDIERVAERNGSSIETRHDLADAACGAHVVYAKSWGSLEHFGDPLNEAELRNKYRNWIIDEKIMQSTAGGEGFFMHCLPIRRNIVATDGVLDGPWSAVIDEAENRLHAQRALLLELIGKGEGK